MNNQLFYFTYSNKGFVYSVSSNNILEISEKAKAYFENEKIDSENIILQEEIQTLINLPENNSPLPKEYFFKNPSIELIDKHIIEVGINLNVFFILELNNKPEIVDYLMSQPEKNKIRFIIKQNIHHSFKNETIKDLIDRKIDFIYYTDIVSFESFIKSSKINNRIFIELRLKSKQDFFKYVNLVVPSNIIVSFKIQSSDLGKVIFNFIENKIKHYFEDKNNNISIYFDIVRLMKFNFGKQYNRVHFFDLTDENSLHINCNNCWAKKICHQTKLYSLYNEDPLSTQQDIEKCNTIRGFSKNYLKLLMFFKELKAKEMLPVYFEKNGYKIKIINP